MASPWVLGAGETGRGQVSRSSTATVPFGSRKRRPFSLTTVVSASSLHNKTARQAASENAQICALCVRELIMDSSLAPPSERRCCIRVSDYDRLINSVGLQSSVIASAAQFNVYASHAGEMCPSGVSSSTAAPTGPFLLIGYLFLLLFSFID